MKLTKFKEKEANKKVILISTGVILIIALVLVVFSYSLYQNVDEVQFVNGTVGTFKELALKEITATSKKKEINLNYITEGIGVNTTCKYGLKEGIYDQEAKATNTNCNMNKLETDTIYYYQICAKNSKKEICKEGNIKTTAPINIVNIGDYISMTPTSTSYTPSPEDTGCMNDSNCTQNTINPSELNLWRVIRKNDDGTVDVVSEYVSSKMVYFYGQIGYLNSVGTLNTIAAQYTNTKYVSKTRYMGYSNQTQKCSSIPSCPADTGYTTDTNLVKAATGTLIGKSSNDSASAYWIASRNQALGDNIYHCWIRGLTNKGDVIDHGQYNSSPQSYLAANSIRPILTLKADVEISSGDGKSANTAYILE